MANKDPNNELRQHLQKHKRQLELLRDRVDRLENLLELGFGDPMIQWLFQNRSERMDATLPIYPAVRREFHLDRYRLAAKYSSNKRVVDIACGTGYGCRILHEVGNSQQVIGVDSCEETIAYAKMKHSGERIEYLCSMGDDTPIADESVDLVVSFETIEHVADDEKLLNEFSRILAPGGKLICSTPNQWPLEIAPHHVRVYDLKKFESVLSKCFLIDSMFNQNSGAPSKYNHQQPQGIVSTNDENAGTAECFIAICTKR